MGVFDVVSKVLHGDSAPGGGVFGYLRKNIVEPTINPVAKLGNDVVAGAKLVNPLGSVSSNEQSAANQLKPGGGLFHQGGVLGGNELTSKPIFADTGNIKKAVGTGVSIGANLAAPGAGGTAEKLSARVIQGIKGGAAIGAAGSAGQQLADNGNINLGQLAGGAITGAALGGSTPVVVAAIRKTPTAIDHVTTPANFRLSVEDRRILSDHSDALSSGKLANFNQNQIDARRVANKIGLDIVSGTKQERSIRIGDYLRNFEDNKANAKQIGGFTGSEGESNHIIPVGDNQVLLIGKQELQDMSKATTPQEVKKIIGDTLPPNTVNKVAPAIAMTKDPNIITGILQRELAPKITEVTPITPAATIQDIKPNTATSVAPSTEPTAAQTVIDNLGEATSARKAQESIYTTERSQRLGASRAAGDSLPGLQGHYAELAALKGEHTKVNYAGLSDKLPKEEQDALFTELRNKVNNDTTIKGYSAVNTNEALRKVIYGDERPPTPSEIKLLQHALGEDFAKKVTEDVANHTERLTALQHAGILAGQIAGVPRTIMATADFSGGLRQGLAAATRHPLIFAKEFVKQFKNFTSEDHFDAGQEAIYNHPDYPLLQQAKVAIQDLTGRPSETEEKFVSNLAEKIPGLGHLVHASNRAYTGLLNNMRANIFYDKMATLRAAGYDLAAPESNKLIKDLGEVINTSTGRGSLGKFESAAGGLSTALFAPRLIASRLQMLNPQYYLKLSGPAKKEALTTLFSLTATITGVLELAHLAGAKVGTDPTSADFGKIKIGDTRLDIAGGYSQYIRLGAQLAENKITSSTTGSTTELGSGFGKPTRLDILNNFLQNKEAPVLSFATTLLKGKDASGQPISLKGEIASRFVPLIIQDAHDILTHPNSAGPGAIAAGIFGVGTQTYGSQDLALSTKQKAYVDKLKSNGESPDVIKADIAFFNSLKAASGTNQATSDAINKAIAANDLEKARSLADAYNQKLSDGLAKWNEQYGSYANADLQKEFNSQKIKLTPQTIKSRQKALKDATAGKL